MALGINFESYPSWLGNTRHSIVCIIQTCVWVGGWGWSTRLRVPVTQTMHFLKNSGFGNLAGVIFYKQFKGPTQQSRNKQYLDQNNCLKMRFFSVSHYYFLVLRAWSCFLNKKRSLKNVVVNIYKIYMINNLYFAIWIFKTIDNLLLSFFVK